MSVRREAEVTGPTIRVKVHAYVSPATEYRYRLTLSAPLPVAATEGPSRVEILRAGTSSVAPGLVVEHPV